MMDKVYYRADLARSMDPLGEVWSEMNIKFVKNEEVLNIYSLKENTHEVGQTINLYEQYSNW